MSLDRKRNFESFSSEVDEKEKDSAKKITNASPNEGESFDASALNKNAPIGVDQSRLDANGRLIPQDQVPSVKMTLETISAINTLDQIHISYFPKTMLGSSLTNGFDVLKTSSDRYFAVYQPPLHRKEVTDEFNPIKENMPQIEILLAQDIDTGKWFILKQYKAPPNSPFFLRVEQEINLLKKVNLFVDSVDDRQSTNTLYVLKEYAPGKDLARVLTQDNLPLEKKIRIAAQVAALVMGLHKIFNILLCDLKLDNVIYDEKNTKVAFVDFDSALEMDSEGKAVTDEFRGTFHAPETFETRPHYVFTEKTDIYALGLMFAKWFDLEEQIFAEEGEKSASDNAELTLFAKENKLKQLASIIQKMVHDNPKIRLDNVSVTKMLGSFMLEQELQTKLENEVSYKL